MAQPDVLNILANHSSRGEPRLLIDTVVWWLFATTYQESVPEMFRLARLDMSAIF